MNLNFTGSYESVNAELKSATCRIGQSDTKWEIPFSSNSIELNGDPSTILDTGLHNWSGNEKIRMYFHVNKSCDLKFGLKCKVPYGNSKVEIKVLGVPQIYPLSGSEYHVVPVGEWTITGAGIVIVDIQGIEKMDDYFADATHLIVAHEVMGKDAISFLDDSDESFRCWNRMRPFQIFDPDFSLGESERAEVPRAEFISPNTEIDDDHAWAVPFSSNSVMLSYDTPCILFDSGIHNWISNDQSVRVYFYVKECCEINLSLKCKVPVGSSKVEVKVLGLSKAFQLSGSDYHNASIGKWKISGSGCVYIDLKAVEKTNVYVADVTQLIVSKGRMEEDTLTFLSSSDHNVLYWMRMTAFTKRKSIGGPSEWKIPFSSNAIKVKEDNPDIFERNLHNWCSNEIIRMYFYVEEPCELNIALEYKVARGNSKIEVKLLDERREITLSGSAYHTTAIGKWNITQAGCVTVDFKGLEKTGAYFADVAHLIVSYDTMQDDLISFLDGSDNNIRYWQRRTPPECHDSNFTNPTEIIEATFISSDFHVDEHSSFWTIPFSANSINLANPSSFVSNAGIHNWTSDAHIRMYLYVKNTCDLKIGLWCKVPRGSSKIKFRIQGVTREYELSGSKYHIVSLGEWKLSGTGCVTVDLEGIEKTHSCFADVIHLVVSKEELEEDAISFLEKNDRNILYWKRLGPHKDHIGDLYNSIDVFGKNAITWDIPFSSNSVELNLDPSTVYDTGIHNWSGDEEIRMYFCVNAPCELNFALKYKVPVKNSKIEINILGNRQILTLSGSEYHITRIGKFSIPTSGWVTVDLKGAEKSGDYYADVTHLIVSQTDMEKDSICFLGDSSDEYFYSKRRRSPRIVQGPSNNLTTKQISVQFISPNPKFNEDSIVWKIPFSCNSIQLGKEQSFGLDSGIRNWNTDKKIRMFFYVKDTCELDFALNCKVPSGKSTILMKVLGVPKVFLLSGSEYHDVPLGKWQITGAGWVTVDLEGFLKTGGYYADVNYLVVLKNNLATDTISFLNDSDEHFLYWKKIGPPQLDMTISTSKITNEAEKVWEIPCSSNSVELSGNNTTIFDTGIHNWCENHEIRIYFHVKEPCELSLSLKCKVPDGSSKIAVEILGMSRTFVLSGSEYQVIPIGTWTINETLVTVDLKGMERTGDCYADITHLVVKKGDLEEDTISFLDDSEENLRYWNSRGSHLDEQYSLSDNDISSISASFLNADSKVDNYHTVWVIPFNSNSVELKGRTDSVIRKRGICSWDSNEVIRTHFYVNSPCELDMTLLCAVPDGSSKIEVRVLGVPQLFTFSGTATHTEPIGKWKISGSGCVAVDLKGIEKTGNYFADVRYLILSAGNLDIDTVSYLTNTDLNVLYWERRGPPNIVLPNDDDTYSQELNAKLISLPNEIDVRSPKWEVSFSANAWVLAEDTSIVSEAGLQEWEEQTVRLYLHVKKPCELDLALKCSVPEGTSEIEVNVLGEVQSFQISGTDYHMAPIGRWKIDGTGYVTIDLKGLKKSGDYYADITHLVIPQSSLEKDTIGFLDGIDSDEIYWRRRGPTIHLNYRVPDECEDAEYYYNEVMVPSGYDNVGSYFAVIGFANGYFGIQVNEVDLRKVLFSVWSPQKTDDADTLTEENQVILVNKDPETVATSFGAEGSGSKSYLRYDWRPDVTYKFLLRGRPDPMIPDYTLYSAWFGERGSPQWRLVAEFSRPRGARYLEELYSFVENMDDDHGHTCRMVRFSNQWIRDRQGNWYEVTAADLTGDGISKEMIRLDFEGGLTENEDGFYMKHCGFFIGKCNLGERLHRRPRFRKPFQDLITKRETELKRNLTVRLVDTADAPEGTSEMYKIPVYANGWLVKTPDAVEVIQRPNLGNWMSPETECHVFFYVGRPMTVDLFMRCKVPDGKSVINVDVCGVSNMVDVEGEDYHAVFLGRYKFEGRDYAKVVLKGASKEGDYFADVTDLMVPKDEVTSQHVVCIPDDDNTPSARKGPRPRLLYRVPKQELSDEMYYVEVLVEHRNPAAKIVAIGFDAGYIAIEDNQIVFSLSVSQEDGEQTNTHFDDNDNTIGTSPNAVKRVVPLTTKDDGDRVSCKFMLRTRKIRGDPGQAVYSAWYAEGTDERPRPICEDLVSAAKGMRGFHSSVEILEADRSHQAAKAVFSHQMAGKTDGSVCPVTEAKVKTDGVVETRVFDYDAGVQSLSDRDGEGFFLRTCGFVMGTDIDGTVIVKRADQTEGSKYFREFLSYGL